MFYIVLDCIATGTIIGVLGHVIFNDKWLPIIPALFLAISGAAISSLVAVMAGTFPNIISLTVGTLGFLMIVHALSHQRVAAYTRLVVRHKVKSIRNKEGLTS